MSLSKHQQRIRFNLLNMALSIRGGQEVPVHELIADANVLNDWVIGVDYTADGSADKSVNVELKVNNATLIGRNELKEFANNYTMQNYQNAGQYKTIALITKNGQEYDCLSVAFYSRSRIEYVDFHAFNNVQEAAETLQKMQPHSILHDTNSLFDEMLRHRKFERVKAVSITNRPCFLAKNKIYFKREYDFALFNTVKAVQSCVFSAIHPSIVGDIVAILDDVQFTLDCKYEVKNNPKSLRGISAKVTNCLSLLFSEKTINMTFTD